MAELKHLTVSGSPADGTTVTTSNTNLVGVSVGASNTFTIEAADAFSKRKIKLVQGAANQITSYLDLTAAGTKIGGIIPLNYSWGGTPVTTTIRRWYPDTGHATNLGSLLITSTNRLQFTEAAGSGTALNVTSSAGTPMVVNTDYMLVYLIDVTANTFDAGVYPVGSGTPLLTISGTLGGAMADAAGVQSMRVGVNTATTTMTQWTSEGETLFDDVADRYDLSGPPTLVVDQPAANVVDLRDSTGTGALTFPTPTHVSGATVTVTSLADGLWLFEQDASADAIYTLYVEQADAQQDTDPVTIVKQSSVNQNAPLIPSGSSPGTGWA